MAERLPNRRAIGGHHSARPGTTTWLTPPRLLNALGPFDLDPCAAPLPRPWPTAAFMNSELDGDGLSLKWNGRVWLNPPFTSAEIEAWLRRMGDHDCGTALILARTETRAFQRQVWSRASGLLFLAGRLHFHHSDGGSGHYRTGFRADSNRSGGTPAHDWANLPDCLRLSIGRLSGVVIENRPAIQVMVRHDSPTTLH